MRYLATILAALAALPAAASPELAKKHACFACHAVDKKLVGPAYKDVAAKYKGDKSAEAMLVDKLKEGKNHPKIGASDAELKAAVGYALSTK